MGRVAAEMAVLEGGHLLIIVDWRIEMERKWHAKCRVACARARALLKWIAEPREHNRYAN